MYRSQSASSSTTPRSTSRVMMTGLIGPDLRRVDCYIARQRRKTCLMEIRADGNPAEKLCISHGRSSKDGYHIYRLPPTILWSFPLRMQFPVELLSRTEGQPRPEGITSSFISAAYHGAVRGAEGRVSPSAGGRAMPAPAQRCSACDGGSVSE